MRRPRMLVVSDGSATPEAAMRALPELLRLRRRIRILRLLPGSLLSAGGRTPDVHGDSEHHVTRRGLIGHLLPDCLVRIDAVTAVAVSISADPDDLTVRAPVSETRKIGQDERLAHAASVVNAAIDACRSTIAGGPIISEDEMDGAVRQHCRILHETYCRGHETSCRLTLASPWRQTLGLLPSDDSKIVFGDLAHPLGDERIPVLDVTFTAHEIVLHEVAGSLRPEHDDPMTRLRDAAAHAALRALVSPTPPAKA